LAAAAILVGAMAVGAVAGGVARGAGPTRADVEARLQKANYNPSAAELAELGPGAGGLLIQIAEDRAAAGPLRLRAMSALAYVRTPAAHDFLETFLIKMRPSSDPTDQALLRKAAVALGWQAGPRTVEVLAALLDHPSPDVRLDAVVALGLTRSQGAGKPLRARMAQETDANVRAQIDRQLKVLDAAADRSRGGSTPAP
jgi:HEAT repeat protein